jgi:hypothetical protein
MEERTNGNAIKEIKYGVSHESVIDSTYTVIIT